jgi:hypothetical protein
MMAPLTLPPMELHVALGRRGRWSPEVYAELRAAILDG